jgi:hypothetical protein
MPRELPGTVRPFHELRVWKAVLDGLHSMVRIPAPRMRSGTSATRLQTNRPHSRLHCNRAATPLITHVLVSNRLATTQGQCTYKESVCEERERISPYPFACVQATSEKRTVRKSVLERARQICLTHTSRSSGEGSHDSESGTRATRFEKRVA